MQYKPRKKHNFISLGEASEGSPYSQEYLSLLARKGRLFSKKIGRNWYTTKEAVRDYVINHGVPFVFSGNNSNELGGEYPRPEIIGAEAIFKKNQKDDSQKTGEGHDYRSRILDEFERLNSPKISDKPLDVEPQETTVAIKKPLPVYGHQNTVQVDPGIQNQEEEHIKFNQELENTRLELARQAELDYQKQGRLDKVEKVLDKVSENLSVISEIQKSHIEKPVIQSSPIISQPIATELPKEQEEFYKIESKSLGHKIRRLNYAGGQSFQSTRKTIGIVVAALVLLFLVGGGFSFGNADEVALRVKDFFKNADSLQGHFAGTHGNEILLLDKDGKVSIYGHIETQGQFRSFAPDGVAPIVVDSMTLVENLNAEYFDGLASKDFTLAFVTKNGNMTYDDVYLEGNVEVGKTLKVKGAAKLLDELLVYGKLGVFGEAVFGKDVQLTSGSLKLDQGSVNISSGNLNLDRGTITLNNSLMIKNLNAEMLQGYKPQDFSLNFIVGNGNETSQIAFFNGGIYGADSAFSSIGVAGDVTIGTEGEEDNQVAIFSKKFSIDKSGNLSLRGNISGVDLTVGGSVKSDLIPSGSYDLGSSARPWNNLFVSHADIGEAVIGSATFESFTITASANIAGTASSSFRLNTDNVSSDSEDSYLAFERGIIVPNATL
ncbi:MAG TPA: hypothetical protein VJH71_02445, partial [Candidatus Paceibacterota bacterium]